ncbi:BTAD domain-containing putative transcriptional regulator [Nonomuraea sp. SBT364]|uniref:BTAD domain-containing putative transcriptional regulator n=1 Tax=Nonomuraea sp. SBT364 TaxID=1580530 RepID=UPI00066B465C|nr:BTAD domain-containing putative transcriptional regulator [Nonomuraea sp. SBT364]
MEFGVLGPLAVWTADGRTVRVPELKVRALLADLLIHEGRPVPADRLADDLWGDNPPGNPGNTLQTKVSQLRRALEQAESGGRELVAYQPAGYALGTRSVDALRFGELVGRARTAGDARTRADLLSDALALWRGPAYADFRDEEFARVAAGRLDEQRLTAVEEQAEARLELGEHSLLADELAGPVAEHPLRERLRAAHLRALYRAGRQSEALAGYAELRRLLDEELGLDPSAELAALHQAILVQDPALAAAPAPTTSAARPRSNLPVPLTELVGREDEVATAAGLLGSARLVTLTGPGGVGKTRLALATAATLTGAFPDGVWLVELAGVSGGTEAVAEVVAARLGVRDETASGSRPGVRPEALARRLAGALRGLRLLLVLDNCEHLVEPVAELAGLLLGAAPELRVLATSQEPLAIPGEVVRAVAPLSLPTGDRLRESNAVRLFVARAAAAAPGFALDAANEEWVAAICRRLDGLPLALELAATRVRALGVRGLAERLDDRFRVLAAAGRGLPARQRTLRAMIDWSWEQLGERQRLALCRLAAHPGGCLLEAAEVVCAGPGLDAGDVPDVLAQLVNRSMVVAEEQPSGETRYRLLESVTAYCLERLGADDPAWERRDGYYVELAERAEPQLYGHGQRRWLRRLDDEVVNLRAVLDALTGRGAADLATRLVRALAWYWYVRGRHTEGHRALSRVASDRTVAWEAGFALLIGDGTGLLAHSRTALERTRDPRGRWFIALAHLGFGDVATAGPLVGEVLAEFRALDDRWGEAAALASHAKQAVFQGDLAAVERSGSRSLELFTELGDGWGRLQASDMLGYLAEITGDYERAGRLHREGLRVAEDLRLWTDVSYRLSSLGRVALLTGDLARSREFHERGLRLAGEQSNRFAEEFARVGLGLVARRAGDLDGAQRLFGESLAWNLRLEADYGVPFYGLTLLMAELGFVAELRGDAEAAGEYHRRGLAAAREGGDPRAIALAWEGLAGVAALEGAYEEAARLLAEAAASRESVGAPLPAAERGDVDRITARLRAAGVPT